jgi:hypothetical protein
MSGPPRDPGRDLEAMVCLYNSGKIVVTATATTASISASTSMANYAKHPNSYAPRTTNYAPPTTLPLALARTTETPDAEVAAAPLNISSAPR